MESINQSIEQLVENSILKKDVNITILYNLEISKNIFWEVANTLNSSLRALGFNSNLNLNCIYNDPNVTNIVFGCQLIYEPDMARLDKNSIIVNLEPLTAWHQAKEEHYKKWFHKILYLASKCQVWDYSHKNIAFLHNFGLTHAKYIHFGYEPSLARVQPAQEQDIDVLFYGWLAPQRRVKIIEELKLRGVNVVVPEEAFGDELDRYLARAKIVLNMHSFDEGVFEIIRCYYLMNNSIAIVSEINPTTVVDEPSYLDGLAAVPYEQLVDKCCELLKDPAALETLREKALAVIKQHPQTEIIKALIQQS